MNDEVAMPQLVIGHLCPSQIMQLDPLVSPAYERVWWWPMSLCGAGKVTGPFFCPRPDLPNSS